MTPRLVAAVVAGAFAVVPAAASADPLPPACVLVEAETVTVQAGYAPNGPSDCARLP